MTKTDVIDTKPRRVSLYRERATGLMHQVDEERRLWRKEATPGKGDYGEWQVLLPDDAVIA